MATIRTAVQLYDGVSSPLKSMAKALDICIESFESMQTASNNSVNVSRLQEARREMQTASGQIESIEDNIRRASDQQKQFNETIRNGSNAASDLKSKFTGLVATIGTVVGLNKVFDLSDEMTQTTARLNMMNDGLQTTEELQQMIFASAQASRGSYQATADAVAKMGIMAKDAFSSNAELVAFTEQLNKQFTIAGTSQEGISAAMLQLTQAMGSGVLRGEELNSVFEQAPTIIQTIADYLDVPIGSIRSMAQEGQLSAEVVKNALLAASDETNKKFESMPKTIGQVWQSIKNQALMAFQPILSKISEIVNSDKFNNLTTGVISAITTIASVALVAFNALASVAGFVYDNWSWIEPIIWAVIAAFVAYNTVSLITNGILAAQALAEGVKAAADALQTGTTFAATAAQYGFNAALLACPITWIVVGILAIIAAIIMVCQWIAKTTGVANSFFGVITGGINVAIQAVKNAALVVANIALGIWNALSACCTNIGIAFQNVITNVQSWFYNLLSTALTVVSGICAALNKLPFVEFDYSGITAKADEYAAKASEAAGNTKEYESISDAFSKGFNTYDTFADGWASDAFKAGASWGDGITDKVSSFFSGGDGITSSLDAFELGNTLDGITNNTGDTAGNTAKVADSMDTLEDSLEYLVDIAEREAINRFTTAEISVEMKNENHINSELDIDGVVEALGNKVYETMLVSAEGVHE